MAGIEYTLTYTQTGILDSNYYYFPLGVDGITAAAAGTKFVVKYLAFYVTSSGGMISGVNLGTNTDNIGSNLKTILEDTYAGDIGANNIVTLVDASAPSIVATTLPINQVILDQSWLSLNINIGAGSVGNVNVTITYSLIPAVNILSNNFLTANGLVSTATTTLMLSSGANTKIIKSLVITCQDASDLTIEVFVTGAGGNCDIIPVTTFPPNAPPSFIYFDAPLYLPPSAITPVSISLVSTFAGGGPHFMYYYISYTSDPRE